MSDYDLREPHYYSHHLSEVNDTHAVIASEDIYNSNGILLVKKGLPIKPDVARRLVEHKLSAPLDSLVNVDNSITPTRLYEDILALLKEIPGLEPLHNQLELDRLLITQCQQYAKFSMLTQKLTVMSLRLPDTYKKSLFCAWMTLAILHKLDRSAAEYGSGFLAGLIHDAGMLHLSPEILNNQGKCTAEEWRSIQAHTLIADAFLACVPDLPPLVQSAVKEHHERCDGSGYPYGLFEERLCEAGQAVAMTDMLYAMLSKRHPLTQEPLEIPDVLPLLQLNEGVHTRAVYGSLVQLVKQVERKKKLALEHEAICKEIGLLLTQQEKLEQRFQRVSSFHEQLYPMKAKRARIACIMLERCWSTVTGSGFLSEPLVRWLQHSHKESTSIPAAEIVEISMMYREMAWQLDQLERVLELLKSDGVKLEAMAVAGA